MSARRSPIDWEAIGRRLDADADLAKLSFVASALHGAEYYAATLKDPVLLKLIRQAIYRSLEDMASLRSGASGAQAASSRPPAGAATRLPADGRKSGD